MAQIYFFHGLESGPRGNKFLRIKGEYPEAKTIDFQGLNDPNDRMMRALMEIHDDEEIVIVGSSMGGLVAYMLEQSGLRKVRGMVLCAPALLRAKEILPVGCPTVVIHGTEDEILDFGETKILSDKIGADFIEVRDNHRLEVSIDQILGGLQEILKKI
jgi:pimeloyl-ACP methyl ester carboxylesterase